MWTISALSFALPPTTMEPLQPFCIRVGVTLEAPPQMEEASINVGLSNRAKAAFLATQSCQWVSGWYVTWGARLWDRMLPEPMLGFGLTLSLSSSLSLKRTHTRTHTHTPMTPRCYTIRSGLDFTRLLSALAVQPSAAQLRVIRNAFSCRAPRRPISWPPGAGCCTVVGRFFREQWMRVVLKYKKNSKGGEESD